VALLKPVVLYDSDCSFCSRSIGWLRSWDRRGALDYVPFNARAGRPELERIEDAALQRASHLVLPDGRAFAGGAAVPELLRHLPGGFVLRPLSLLPGMPSLTRTVYDWVARRKHGVPGESPECRLP
jgi:predicted DCC family thiol-disulfide oxidoreductase YuxK